MSMVGRRTVGLRDSGTARGAGLGNVSVGELAAEFDEKAIVDAAQQGDQKALSALYDHYFPRVYRYVATAVFDRRRKESPRRFSPDHPEPRPSPASTPFGAWVSDRTNEVVSHVRRQKADDDGQLTEYIQDLRQPRG